MLAPRPQSAGSDSVTSVNRMAHVAPFVPMMLEAGALVSVAVRLWTVEPRSEVLGAVVKSRRVGAG
jgi:hypothetical protein